MDNIHQRLQFLREFMEICITFGTQGPDGPEYPWPNPRFHIIVRVNGIYQTFYIRTFWDYCAVMFTHAPKYEGVYPHPNLDKTVYVNHYL